MSGADDAHGWAAGTGWSWMTWDFIMLLRRAHNLKLMTLFLEFSILIFHFWTMVDWATKTMESETSDKTRKGGLLHFGNCLYLEYVISF